MKKIYVPLGTLLVAIGAAGFVQPSPLFGLFAVNTFHNIVHLASGALTLSAAAQGVGAMRTWGRIFGLFYVAFAILGFAAPDVVDGIHLNTPDNLLHLVVALVFLYVALIAPPRL
jgi:Domain of unknown function (DUF4383)